MSMNAEKVREKLVNAITAAGYSISGFANSSVPKKLGIKGGNTLRCFLQGNSISLKSFKVLYKYFGLGELDRKIETVRTVTYDIKPGTATGKLPAVDPADLKQKPVAKKKLVKKAAVKQQTPIKKKAAVKKSPVKKAAPAPRKVASSLVRGLKNSPATKKLMKAPAKKIKKKAVA